MGLLLGILLPCLLKRLPVGLSKAQGPDRPCGSAGRAFCHEVQFQRSFSCRENSQLSSYPYIH